ncbi:serine hydrolase domain-containing protein [Sphingosinicella sp. LHD-64]|uniref:serine hydrolase domain-containing protein n=1 Tax=Sphingosinicella sp. LHD-64 TaxID=3072139 RepID=UPI00280FBDBE|nr:serine hydrolase domain-containing protein [Sphingosinicella sp. LHD-64]MDQ8755355.1 serine hydrolase domain-containing protein [Sphingosinicella sp. LHD-64]
MRHALIAALLLGAATPAWSQAAPAQTAPAATPPTVEQVAARMDETFRRYQQEQHVPGLVWGIVRDGRLVHFGAAGRHDLESDRPVDVDSLFRIASMSKAFTALAILKLRDDGRLRLDALAEEYVPELRNWRYPTTDTPRIRVRDLLSHVGGFVTDDPWGDRQQVLTEAEFTRMLRAGVPFTRAPQTRFEYSNFGYALLGRIVTNVSGRPYQDYIREEVMRPLGMASTGYDISAFPRERRAIGYRWENEAHAREPDMRDGVFGSMGGVQTSASDYARWVAFLLSAWPARDGPEQGPVRRSSVRELAQGLNFVSTQTRPGLSGGEPCRFAMAYGMGMIAAQDCDLGLVVRHSGGYPGYGSYMMLLPEHGTGVFAFSSRTYTAPGAQVMETALELRRAGLLVGRAIPVSEALAANYAAAAAMFGAGSIEPGRARLAMNFLMDRSPENWAREFARLKGAVGECRTDAPITATGALAGTFTWACARGNLQGQLLLGPTNPPTIQALRLRVAPAQ